MPGRPCCARYAPVLGFYKPNWRQPKFLSPLAFPADGHRLLRRRSHDPSDDDQHFDAWSRTYDRSAMQVLFFGPIHQAVSAALAGRLAAGRLLDIGTGTGRRLDRLGQGRPGLAPPA